MLEHIVKNGETLDDILGMYRLEVSELKKCNLHITDFHNLVSGMKIKIPLINNEIEQILDNTESFVQTYYPKIKPEVLEEEKTQKVVLNEEVKPAVEEPSLPKGRAYPGILPPKIPYKRA